MWFEIPVSLNVYCEVLDIFIACIFLTTPACMLYSRSDTSHEKGIDRMLPTKIGSRGDNLANTSI